MSLIDDLARIREMQGKEPLASPHIIQGFEPNSPPVPPLLPMEVDSPTGQVIEDEFLDGGPPANEPASPLIPRRLQERQREQANLNAAPVSFPAVALFALAVGDRNASWKGRDVLLTEAEEKQVRGVVLKAIRRELDADMALAGVKRTRRAKAKPEAAGEAPVQRRKYVRKVRPVTP